MKKGKDTINRVQVSKFLFIIPFLLFLAVILQMCKLSLSTTVDGVDLKKFASNRNTMRETLYANRGTIYTSNGSILAQNIRAYTVIAYLSPKRSKGAKTPQHVVDKEATAKALAPVLEMEESSILKLLSKENLYQVEIKRGITELKKEEIEKLQLYGIDFVGSYKRYYPNGDFLSYTLGYVNTSDDNKMTGEMGIEKYFNKELSGSNGYLEYQKDLNGYKIPNTPEVKKDEEDGKDIYLTIDENIQMFTEQAIKESTETYKPEWMLAVVADAKTGKILGSASTPSFDPNIRNIKNYLNPLVSYAFEPGSTMKTFTYMAAIEKGTYDGNATYTSGKLVIGDDTISDWNRVGWGTINFDRGYTLSSNVGAASIVDRFITSADLKSYFKKLGFGQKTGITLSNEASGEVDFKYKVEVANAAFGQGITSTPIQFVQALTSIANDGVVLKPYIVEKIVDSSTGKTVYQGAREEVDRVASKQTIDKIKDLMYYVVNGDPAYATGYNFKVNGVDLIGKTGTAQYVDPSTGKYYDGENGYIRSFSGMFPKDNPQIILYVVAKKPAIGTSTAVAKAVIKLVNNISKYMNIYSTVTTSNENYNPSFTVPNLKNKSISTLSSLSHSSIIIGDGDKIINQYPVSGTIINKTDKFFILTNGKNKTLEKMTGWSVRDVDTYCNLINIKCNTTGYGFVSSQDISGGTNISTITEINLQLKRTSDDVKIDS